MGSEKKKGRGTLGLPTETTTTTVCNPFAKAPRKSRVRHVVKEGAPNGGGGKDRRLEEAAKGDRVVLTLLGVE